MLVQHEARLTRKTWPSAASSYQAIFCSQGIKRPARMSPIRLRRRNALDQRIASSTRKTRPSAASGYQAMFCSQGIKNHRTCRWFLMDYTFWGCTQVIYSYIWWIVKLGWYSKAYIIPFAFFGVLRTFFAKKVLSRRRHSRRVRPKLHLAHSWAVSERVRRNSKNGAIRFLNRLWR